MRYEAEAIKGFSEYCREKRKSIAETADGEEKARQEKMLVARSLLHHESEHMVSIYARYTAVVEENGDVEDRPFWNMQEAMVEVVCAGLEDTSFNKWKANVTDAVCRVQASEQVKRMPRFSKTCGNVLDSLYIDFSDIEAELRVIFEPECIYNTLVLLVSAVKSYCDFLDRMCDRQKK